MGALALLNAYFDFNNVSSYSANQAGLSTSILVAGYLGMFFSMAVLPIPDYVLVPVYGYLCTIGVFDPVTTFLCASRLPCFP